MSAYIFTIRNYHAIEEAEIRIEGITVLAGLNGSGKSTVARWFHRMVKTLNNYERIRNSEASEEYRELIQSIKRMANVSPKTRPVDDSGRIVFLSAKNPDGMRNYLEEVLNDTMSLLQEKLSSDEWRSNYPRLCNTYGLERLPEESMQEFHQRLSVKISAQFDDIRRRRQYYLTNRSMQHLNEVLAAEVDLSVDDLNIDISLKEDGVELLDIANFLQPLNLRDSLYIETQSLVEPLHGSMKSELRKYLKNVNTPANRYSQAIATSVKKIIGGDVVLEDRGTGMYMDQDDLHYVREDGLNILLRGAATGIISFSHILRLLENGWITKESVLIIDEPEAHLHPQWIVEYARILVLINRHIGAKVLISTHSPDMVAAIRSISERQDVLPTTLFFLALPTDGNRYRYKDLGHDIGLIFDSFNIASERIDQYGVTE